MTDIKILSVCFCLCLFCLTRHENRVLPGLPSDWPVTDADRQVVDDHEASGVSVDIDAAKNCDGRSQMPPPVTKPPSTMPTPTPAPTKAPHVEISVHLTDHDFSPGEHFELVLQAKSLETRPVVADVYCGLIVVIGDTFLVYWWPTWTENLSCSNGMWLLPEQPIVISILAFDWPSGAGNSLAESYFIGLLSAHGQFDVSSLWAAAGVGFTYSEPPPPSRTPTHKPLFTPTPSPTSTPSPTVSTHEFTFVANPPVSNFCADPSRPLDCDYCFSIQHGNMRIVEVIGELVLLADYPVEIQISTAGEAFDIPAEQVNPVLLTPAAPTARVTLKFFTEVPVYEWKVGTVVFTSMMVAEEHSLCGYFSWF